MKRFMLLLVGSMLALSGCSKPHLVSSWSQPDYSGPTLKKIMIVGVSDNDLMRRVYEDNFVKTLKTEGVDAVASYTLVEKFADDKDQNVKLLKAAAGKISADSVLVTSVSSVDRDDQYIPGSTVYVSNRGSALGMYGMHGYYGYSYDVVNSAGYTVENTTVKMQSAVFSAADGTMLWSGATSDLNPDSAAEVVTANIKLVNNALKASGLL